MNYCTYGLSNRSLRYNDTVLSYIAKQMNKTELQIRAHFFDIKCLQFVIEYLVEFQLACKCNKIREDAASWVLFLNVKDSLANTLNRCLYVGNWIPPLAIFLTSEQHPCRRLLCSYSREVSRHLKK